MQQCWLYIYSHYLELSVIKFHGKFEYYQMMHLKITFQCFSGMKFYSGAGSKEMPQRHMSDGSILGDRKAYFRYSAPPFTA